MCEFNTKITITQLFRLTIASAKSKIYSPRRGYLSQGNSIVLGIAATLLFISVTSFCRFWGSFCWNSRTLDLRAAYSSQPQNSSSYHISTDVCKFVKLKNYTTWYIYKRWKFHRNIFQRNIYWNKQHICCKRQKALPISIACAQTRHTIGVTKHMQLNKCLTVHIKPFPKEPWP